MNPVLPRQGRIRRLGITGVRGAVGRCRDFSAKALADWEWLPSGGLGRHPSDEPYAWDSRDSRDAFDAWDAWDTSTDSEPDWDEERRAVAEDVLMVVSEMVTNACLHAGGPLELVLDCTSERLRIEVSDGSPEAPRPRPYPHSAVPGGHGLVVLRRLARAWGSVRRDSGKTVWAEVAAPVRRERPRGAEPASPCDSR
ncbi:ATP-binding protein [Streptomyces pacificus]|uniref:ATP-binding protein n=1 Tax=Streptomyces pacificus TaxID=2705029 RepID=A0A6A0AZ48_9ACTN|nr:ATP-binding protein [Streptomyces pacificus]GFH38162.1 ATP-binding protein [Streptomyces pacificus]